MRTACPWHTETQTRTSHINTSHIHVIHPTHTKTQTQAQNRRAHTRMHRHTYRHIPLTVGNTYEHTEAHRHTQPTLRHKHRDENRPKHRHGNTHTYTCLHADTTCISYSDPGLTSRTALKVIGKTRPKEEASNSLHALLTNHRCKDEESFMCHRNSARGRAQSVLHKAQMAQSVRPESNCSSLRPLACDSPPGLPTQGVLGCPSELTAPPDTRTLQAGSCLHSAEASRGSGECVAGQSLELSATPPRFATSRTFLRPSCPLSLLAA